MVADIALTHSTADIKRHGRCHLFRRFTAKQNLPDLGAVSVNHGNFIPGKA